MCDVFADCDSNGEEDVGSPEGAERTGPLVGITDMTGLATIRFSSPQDAQAYEGCSIAFDANAPGDTCVNRGTGSSAETSQICRGSASDCRVMSTMCTLYGFSEQGDFEFAFGHSSSSSPVISTSSIPDMNYGECEPCNCDPVAILENKDPQISGLVTSDSNDAEAQLVGITTMTGFIALADAFVATTMAPRYTAVLSPGRQAVTKAINEQGQGAVKLPFDMTDSSTILSLLLEAQAFWEMQRRLDSPQRLLQDDSKLMDVARLTAELNQWYQTAAEDSDSSLEVINSGNLYAVSRALLIDQVVNEDELSTVEIEGIVEQARQDPGLAILTLSPTPAPASDDGGGNQETVIGATVGAAGGGLLLVVAAVYYLQQSKNGGVEKDSKENFSGLVTTVNEDDTSNTITIGAGGNLSGGGMKLAEQTHDDLPSATI